MEIHETVLLDFQEFMKGDMEFLFEEGEFVQIGEKVIYQMPMLSGIGQQPMSIFVRGPDLVMVLRTKTEEFIKRVSLANPQYREKAHEIIMEVRAKNE